MSKNPAWNAYNESTRKINEEYEATVKPLRTALSKDIAATEKKLDAKIEPLLLEKKQLVEKLKADFGDKITEAEKTRRTAMTQAQKVLNAERSALRTEAAAQ